MIDVNMQDLLLLFVLDDYYNGVMVGDIVIVLYA